MVLLVIIGTFVLAAVGNWLVVRRTGDMDHDAPRLPDPEAMDPVDLIGRVADGLEGHPGPIMWGG